jgi:mannose-1-phosphate guanylyltransferase
MKTKYVLIPDISEEEIKGGLRAKKPYVFQPLLDGKSAFELSIEKNSAIVDSVMVVGQVANFKFSRNALLKMGIYNYDEIIEARSKNTSADFAFAAFESNQEDILLISTTFPPYVTDDYYYNTLEHAKKLAANGNIVLIDMYQEDQLQDQEESFIPPHRIYCFKAQTYLDELLQHDPVIYYSVRRAHFKKSGSFINELLNELIPTKNVEEAVLDKSDKVKSIMASFKTLDTLESNQKFAG